MDGSDGMGRRRRMPRWAVLLILAVLLLVVAPILLLVGYDLYWKHRLNSKLDELREAGQPVTWAEVLATRPDVPDEENAALAYMAAMDWLYDDPAGALFLKDDPGFRPSPTLRKLMRDNLEANRTALEGIREGRSLPGSLYPIGETEEMPYAILMPHLEPMRQGMRLCARAAVDAALDGRTVDSVEYLHDLRGICRSLEDDLFLISHLVAVAGTAIMVDGAERALALAEFSREDLDGLADACADMPMREMLRRAFITERAAMLDVMLDPPSDVSSLWGGARGDGLYVLYELLPGWNEQDAVFAIRNLTAMIDATELPFAEGIEKASAIGATIDEELDFRHLLSAMLMPALSRVFEQGGLTQAKLRVARTATAAERYRLDHGSWPDSLSDLVPDYLTKVPGDPFTGEPLRYAHRDDGVCVYGMGPDGVDNGGIAVGEAHGMTDVSWNQLEYDVPFRLLDPEMRGARQATFADEIKMAELTRSDLAEMGFTDETLRELGVEPDDLDADKEEMLRKYLTDEQLEELGISPGEPGSPDSPPTQPPPQGHPPASSG